MRDVWLMRHGHAVPDAPGGDAARPLTREGERVVDSVGRALRAMAVRPDVVWHSPFVRARQTAERVAAALEVRNLVEQEGITPLGSARVVADEIFAANARRLFVVSHLPLLPEVCAELLGAPARVDMGPGSVVHLRLLGGARARGAAVLSGFYAADALSALAPA